MVAPPHEEAALELMARVLIVEPHRAVREPFGVVCRAWGHHVATAGEAREALALAAAFRPEVVLLDSGRIGHLSGADVARRIRELDGDSPFIVVFTSWAPLRERASALRAGANACFPKPVDLALLRRMIERAVERVAPDEY